MGTRPSGPTRMEERRLQMQGHHGQRGAGRSAERFSLAAACQAASGVLRSSRWRSWELRWVGSLCEQEVGGGQLGDGLGGEEGREAVLPVLMAAFDFSLGLGVKRRSGS